MATLLTLRWRLQNEPSCDQSVFNDDKINVIEMPGNLIVAANVDKSEIIHTLTQLFIYSGRLAPVLVL